MPGIEREEGQEYHADEVRDDCGVYGALFSSSDMYIFDELLNQLRAIERENAFLSENDLPFSSLFITDFRDSSRGYVGKSISKKKKVQSVLVHRKPKVSIIQLTCPLAVGGFYFNAK